MALSLNVAMVIAWGNSGQIVYCNAVTEELLLREIQLPGAVDWQGFRRPGLPLAPEEYPLSRALNGEEHVADDLYFMRGDGTLTYLRVQAVPIRTGGRIVGAVAMAWPLPAPGASAS
ncbi:MAG: PAS domain-containing protein [Fimbriimonas sp.]